MNDSLGTSENDMLTGSEWEFSIGWTEIAESGKVTN